MRSFWSAAVGGLLLVATGAPGVPGAEDTWASPEPKPGGQLVLQVALAENEDPSAAGKAAAESLRRAMAGVPLRAVLLSECFEDQENKAQVLAAVASVLPADCVVGMATYGSLTRAGCSDADSVCLLGIGGEGVGVAAALVTSLGTSRLTVEEHRGQIERLLHAAGQELARKLHRSPQDKLLILLADAHSPKNQFLVEGVQKIVGPKFPITGGCANKNAGQTFVYFRGKMYEDSAVALMLSGDFRVGLAGRKAQDNENVIRTAEQGAAEALAAVRGKPLAAVAFDCAGRRNKLKNIQDELAAMQRAIGKDLPLFGCYCAGEMGPVDSPDQPAGPLCGGSGWHVMFTVFAR